MLVLNVNNFVPPETSCSVSICIYNICPVSIIKQQLICKLKVSHPFDLEGR